MKSLLLSLLVAFSVQASRAQNLVSIELIEDVPVAAFSLRLLVFGFQSVDDTLSAYRVQYTMDNLSGEQDTVSGLFVRPRNSDGSEQYPRLVYQHGTTADKFGVPSRAAVGTDGAYLFASQGYAAIAPDFLNMGDDQEGFHPYVHAETEALAAVQMLKALESAPEFADIVTDQLFVTGYSQGGHASMALHEYIVENPDAGLDVTAAVHMSGPYSVSDIMRNEVILKDTTFLAFGFLPYTVLSYQAVYPELDEELDEVFRAPYVPFVEAFRDGYATGAVRLDTLTFQLLRAYAATEGDSTFFPSRMLTPEFADRLRDPNDPYVVALRDNDTYDFVNPDPTRLYYCRADDQVSYLNSLVALDTLNQLGATDTEALDVRSSANHTECILPAFQNAVQFFSGFQTIVSSTRLPGADAFAWVQAGNTVRIETGSSEPYTLEVFDAMGRSVHVLAGYRSGEVAELGHLRPGFVAARLVDAQGRTASRAMMLR